jgi:hypothetical protein
MFIAFICIVILLHPIYVTSHQFVILFILNQFLVQLLFHFLHLIIFIMILYHFHIFDTFILIHQTSQISNSSILTYNLFLYQFSLSKSFLSIQSFIQIKPFLFQIHSHINISVFTFIIIFLQLLLSNICIYQMSCLLPTLISPFIFMSPFHFILFIFLMHYTTLLRNYLKLLTQPSPS